MRKVTIDTWTRFLTLQPLWGTFLCYWVGQKEIYSNIHVYLTGSFLTVTCASLHVGGPAETITAGIFCFHQLHQVNVWGVPSWDWRCNLPLYFFISCHLIKKKNPIIQDAHSPTWWATHLWLEGSFHTWISSFREANSCDLYARRVIFKIMFCTKPDSRLMCLVAEHDLCICCDPFIIVEDFYFYALYISCDGVL